MTLAGLSLNGVNGNNAEAPDSAALSIISDIEIRVKLTMPRYAPSRQQHFGAKFNTASQRSWFFRLASTNTISLSGSANGTTTTAGSTSGSNIPFTDNVSGWLKVGWRNSDNRLQYHTSVDGTTWTQYGSDGTLNLANIFDSTAVLEIGSLNGRTDVLLGIIHRFQIRNNVLDDGTGIVFDANFEAQAPGTTSFTESSSNAATVTLNGSAAIVAAWKPKVVMV